MAPAGQNLVEAVRAALRQAQLGTGDRLIVGLSGGVDSQTLAHLLARLRASGDGPDLRLVHVDHRLRTGSANDARAVGRVAAALSLPLSVIPVNVNEWRESTGEGLESAARAARYAALAGAANAWGTEWIAVGHNRDDQVETVILRLARGASLDGLAGMRTVSSRAAPLDPAGTAQAPINLLRPLLSTRRSDIDTYAAEHQLQPIVDETNTDPRFRRNAIRHELIPLLERIVPGASISIARNADLLADDVALLQDLALAALDQLGRRTREALWLDREAFRSQPPALQRRVVVLAVRAMSDRIDLSRERVDALRSAVLTGAAGSRIEIGRGLAALVDYNALLIGPGERLDPELRTHYALPELAPETTIELARSMTVSAGARWMIEIDLPEGAANWLLRTRAPGDRLRLPNGKHARVQDWLVDRKVPRALREWLPLLVCDGEVRWVAGVSEPAYEDVHSRLTARLIAVTGDAQRDGEHARDD